MKRRAVPAVMAIAAALLLFGCGKNPEQKKLESDLNNQVVKGHEAQMAKLTQADDLLTQVEAAIVMYDSLVAAFPKQTADQSKADLLSAKDRLNSSKDALESWMSNYQPFNEGVKHAIAMAQLRKEWDTLVQAGQQLDSAIAGATLAVDAHKKFADDLIAASPKKKHR